MKVDELVTVKEAASSLKVGQAAIRRLIRTKRLPAKRAGPGYVIARQDVEGMKRNGEQQEAVRGALEDVYEECRSDNWDGYGAKRVGRRSYSEAARFCALLPASMPAPDVAADPDGEITFEWHEGQRKAFSVSVGPKSQLTYAGVFGKNKAHGVEHFGDEFPDVILGSLHRLL